jgi:hypothetical protein
LGWSLSANATPYYDVALVWYTNFMNSAMSYCGQFYASPSYEYDSCIILMRYDYASGAYQAAQFYRDQEDYDMADTWELVANWLWYWGPP